MQKANRAVARNAPPSQKTGIASHGTAQPASLVGQGQERPAPLFILSLPCLPPEELRTNGRDGTLNRWTRARLVKEARAQFAPVAASAIHVAAGHQALPLLACRVYFEWVLYVPALRGDWDGWTSALKPWQDQIVVEGLLPGDGPRWVGKGSVEIIKDVKRAPASHLTVWRA